jgi:hypothetical protein
MHRYGCVCESVSRDDLLRWKTCPECGQYHAIGWGPGQSKRGKRRKRVSTDFLSLLPNYYDVRCSVIPHSPHHDGLKPVKW